MRRLAIGLVHYPVLDAKGAVGTSTLTNIDVHDLSRSAKTFGCSDFFVVHSIEAQRVLADKIVEHWTHGSSATRIPDRKNALALVRVVVDVEDAVAALGTGTQVWVTGARASRPVVTFAEGRTALEGEGPPILLLFGTSWGLAPSLVARADALLEPIVGRTDFNHLSVRSACAIALDRLCAPR